MSKSYVVSPCTAYENPLMTISILDHDFASFQRPSYCDHCQLFIWGISKRSAYRCANCKFTVHSNCVSNISTKCKWKYSQCTPMVRKLVPIFSFIDKTGRSPLTNDLNNKSPKRSPKINSKNNSPNDSKNISNYKTQSGQYTLNNTETLNKFVSVNNCVVHGQLSIYINIRSFNIDSTDFKNSEVLFNNKSTLEKNIGSYYKLKNSTDSLKTNRINITAYSDTTAKEIIHKIMDKLKINSFSRNYCLVVKNFEAGDIYISRIKDDDFPLKVLSERGPNPKSNFICFEENEFEEICWDNFRAPELGNFLKILDADEESQLKYVKDVYWEYSVGLLLAMKDKLMAGNISSM